MFPRKSATPGGGPGPRCVTRGRDFLVKRSIHRGCLAGVKRLRRALWGRLPADARELLSGLLLVLLALEPALDRAEHDDDEDEEEHHAEREERDHLVVQLAGPALARMRGHRRRGESEHESDGEGDGL